MLLIPEYDNAGSSEAGRPEILNKRCWQLLAANGCFIMFMLHLEFVNPIQAYVQRVSLDKTVTVKIFHTSIAKMRQIPAFVYIFAITEGRFPYSSSPIKAVQGDDAGRPTQTTHMPLVSQICISLSMHATILQ